LVKPIEISGVDSTGLVLERAGEILDILVAARDSGVVQHSRDKETKSVFLAASAAAIIPWTAPADLHIIRGIGSVGTYLLWVSATYVTADSSAATEFRPWIISKLPATNIIIEMNTKVQSGQVIYVATSAGGLVTFFYTLD
jgi:hypothetical protein